jgi:putative restriction endonuclease
MRSGLTSPMMASPSRREDAADGRGFVEEVLSAYAYQCAMCGCGGALLRNPAGLHAAHLQWHSQGGGPDDLRNGIALCAIPTYRSTWASWA